MFKIFGYKKENEALEKDLKRDKEVIDYLREDKAALENKVNAILGREKDYVSDLTSRLKENLDLKKQISKSARELISAQQTAKRAELETNALHDAMHLAKEDYREIQNSKTALKLEILELEKKVERQKFLLTHKRKKPSWA